MRGELLSRVLPFTESYMDMRVRLSIGRGWLMNSPHIRMPIAELASDELLHDAPLIWQGEFPRQGGINLGTDTSVSCLSKFPGWYAWIALPFVPSGEECYGVIIGPFWEVPVANCQDIIPVGIRACSLDVFRTGAATRRDVLDMHARWGNLPPSPSAFDLKVQGPHQRLSLQPIGTIEVLDLAFSGKLILPEKRSV